jgi:hypothetical protein
VVAAVFTTTTLNSLPTPREDLVNGYKTALTNAGFPSLLQEYVSGNLRYIVYEFNDSPGDAFGKTYMRLGQNTSSQLTVELFSTWNTGTQTGTNASSSILINTNPGTATPVVLTAINHSELRGFTTQNGPNAPILVATLRPLNKPAAWNEASHNYRFLFAAAAFGTVLGCSSGASVYNLSNPSYPFSAPSSLSSPSVLSGRRDIIPRLMLFSPTVNNTGITGQTSGDIGIAACNGTVVGDILEVVAGSEEYRIIQLSSSPGPGLVIRST